MVMIDGMNHYHGFRCRMESGEVGKRKFNESQQKILKKFIGLQKSLMWLDQIHLIDK